MRGADVSVVTADERRAVLEPIRFRREALASRKLYLGTTQRACAPEETLARIEPLLPLAGITRCADITGLDRLGIPVTLAIRPNARLIVGATGKGTTLVQAKVSGLMEALEVHHAEYAEQAPLERVVASYTQLFGDGADLIPTAQLPIARHGTFDADWPMSWVWGFDLVRQSEVPVPFLYVHIARDFLPNDIARLPYSQFIAGSNGLASGNTLLEAIAAGLYEVIERDGIAVWDCAQRAGRPPRTVAVHRWASAAVAELADRCARAGLELIVRDFTTDIAVPTYGAVLVDTSGQGLSQPACGFGAHLDPEVALVRAITEAAQSRVVIIAGSRDDVFTADRFRPGPAPVPGSGPLAVQRESQASNTFQGDLRTLLTLLSKQGMDRVVVTDLRQAPFDLDVVKVWVPGLEEYCLVSQYQPGDRAADWMRHTAAERVGP